MRKLKKILEVKDKYKALLVCFFIVAFSVSAFSASFYYLSVLPRYEEYKLAVFTKEQQLRTNIEQDRRDRELEDKKRKSDSRTSCLSDAHNTYTESWSRACSDWKKIVDLAWKNCRENIYPWETDSENRARCVPITPDYEIDENDMCLLPSDRSQLIESRYNTDTNNCHERYR